jgi:putative secretion ATPase (PEP-CTERM system associated)
MYTEFFGLSGKPFQLSPDVNFFFPSKEHSRALSFLQYGIDQADGFIVITGGVGTGKTTLVQALLKELDTQKLLVSNIVTTQLKEDDLLQLVASNFGLEANTASKAMQLRDLERLFQKESKEGRRVLLVVDEAQNLPPDSVEELRMLSNFQANGRPLVQVFLLGQEEFRATLLSPGFEQLRQRVTATYHLNPLNEEETRTYIEHRLSKAGWVGDPEFTDEAVQAVFEFCQGVPRRINNLCDRLLLYAFLEELHKIDAHAVEMVSEEIGSEFWAGLPEKPAPEAPQSESTAVFDTPGERLETMAKVMFDKANVQQRLAALERAVDGLGLNLKPEVAGIREELSYVRSLLEDLVHEVRQQNDGSPDSKRRA